MSIVPQYGLLRKHFEEAVQDIEYKLSAFWQVYLQRAFREVETYSVTTESWPDGSKSQVDTIVQKYDADHSLYTVMLWGEIGPTASIGEVETQALDAALYYMMSNNLAWIYVITTFGVSFRTWIVESGADILRPLYVVMGRGDGQQYINADTEDAHELTKTISRLKDQNSTLRDHVKHGYSEENLDLSL